MAVRAVSRAWTRFPAASARSHAELVARPLGARSMGFGNRPRGSDSKFYDELGLQRDASQDDIKRAYKKLAMQHHPDRGGSREKFEAVTRAYEVLSDPQQRQSYDQFGEAGVGQEGQGPGPGNVDPMDLFSHIFGFQGQTGRQG